MQETVSLHAIAREPPCRAAPRLAQMPLSGITPGGDAVEGTSMQAEETVKEHMVVAADEKRDRESTAAAAVIPSSQDVPKWNVLPLRTQAPVAVARDNGGMTQASQTESSGATTFARMPISHWRNTPGFLEWLAFQMSLPRDERYSGDGISPLMTSSEPSDADDESVCRESV